MTKSVILSISPADSLTESVMFHFTTGRLFFDAAAWDDALPGGKSASVIKVTTTYLETAHGKPDFTMDVTMKLFGDFSRTEAGWSGEIVKAVLDRDGTAVAAFKINSDVDLGRVANVSSSGLIWNELTQTGLRGKLSSSQDYVNLTLGDDIVFAGRGADNINGSRGNDRINGGGGDDLLDGFDGNDVLIGSGGNDRLEGKGGDDRALGGAGRDTFAFDYSGTNVWTGGKGADAFQPGAWRGDDDVSTTVTDFSARQGDTLDLTEYSALLFNEVTGVRYIGSRAFSGEAGILEIRMKNGIVSIDHHGDGIADAALRLEGLGHFRPAKTDWIAVPDWYDLG